MFVAILEDNMFIGVHAQRVVFSWKNNVRDIAVRDFSFVPFFASLKRILLETCVGPLALTNDKIYGPSNVNGPLRDRYDFQTL